MPAEPKPAILVQNIAEQQQLPIDHIDPNTYQQMLRRAEVALAVKRSSRARTLDTGPGRNLTGLITNYQREPGVVTAAAIANELGMRFLTVKGQQRSNALHWASRLETAKARQEPRGCLDELRAEIRRALTTNRDHVTHAASSGEVHIVGEVDFPR